MTFDPNMLVQSVRGVGNKGGYPYYAYGLYAATLRTDGVWWYRLIDSGPWFRSDVDGKTAFPNVPIVPGIRHGSRCPQ